MAQLTRQPRARKHRLILGGVIALLVIAVAGYITYDLWVVQQKTNAILRAPGVVAGADNTEKANEGSETKQPSVDDLSDYKVAASAPRVLRIDALNVAARVRPMGLNSDKSIQAPVNIYDAGWYTGSAKPGEDGALFIDGHASGATRYGLFGSLDTLKQGDTMTIEKGDGTTLTYKVVHTETVALDKVDMNKALAPYPGVKKGLNLMTCTGVWLNESATLDKRVVVYTEQIEA